MTLTEKEMVALARVVYDSDPGFFLEDLMDKGLTENEAYELGTKIAKIAKGE